MATIHVKAAKTTTDPEEVVFDSEYAGIWKGQPNRVQVLGDGKAVAVNGKHIQVKQALKAGILVEVRHGAKADEQLKADAPKADT